MDYSRITDLLGKFSKIINDSDSKKELIISILFKHTQKTFLKENLKTDKNILVINASPLIKNEIYMNKFKILEEFKILNLNIKDIR